MFRKILLRFVIPVAIVVAAGLGARMIFALAPRAAEAEAAQQVVPVDVLELQPQTVTSIVNTTGLVVPAREITIMPELNGRIVVRADALIPGGRLAAGALIARIDPRDYLIARRQEASRVQAAELDLETERARQAVARREWALLEGDRPPEQGSLALRRPQVATREAGLDAAQGGVERARLNLSRTTLRAPWNAVVVEASCETGQVVGPGTKVARLYGTDQFWVRASVQLAELGVLDVPGVNGDQGSEARVIHELGPGRRVTRQGQVLRLESQLDNQTRMAQVLIAVDDPLDEPPGEVPLLPGSYVTVEILGRTQEGVFAVPRSAVTGGDTVWIVDGESHLSRRTVVVRWGTTDQVYVTGLQGGDRLVTTHLALPVEGLAVAVQPTTERGSDG